MADTLTFRFYKLCYNSIYSQEAIDKIQMDASALEHGAASEWLGEMPNRYGFSRGRLFEETVWGGQFGLEYREEKPYFSKDKVETIKTIDAFEKRLFIIDTSSLVVGLEATKFISRPSLSAEVFRDRFIVAISALFGRKEANLPLFELQPLEWRESKSKFLDIFSNKRVTKLVIDFTEDATVPADLVLFNPHFDKNAMMLSESQSFIRSGLRRIVTEMDHEKGNLRNQPYVKPLIHAGEPREIEYEEDAQISKIRQSGPVERQAILKPDDPEFEQTLAELVHEYQSLPIKELLERSFDVKGMFKVE